ncbi:MAG: hypothetical protein ACRDXX_04825 [Stackebrandtia sp.]
MMTTSTRRRLLTTLVLAVIVWACAYGAVQTRWALDGPPDWTFPSDLLLFTGWGAVVLTLAAAISAAALVAAVPNRIISGFAWGVAALTAANSAMLMLDALGGLVPATGVPFDGAGFASRAGSVTGAALLALAALLHRGYLPPHVARTRDRVPGWARVAAYLAVAGCLVRIGSQAIANGSHEGSAFMTVVAAGFLLAGTVLPLALVHDWGRTFPSWAAGLAGRRVPRLLPLIPAFAVSGAICGYFGLGALRVLFSGGFDESTGSYSAALVWLFIAAYLVWGAGLGVAAIAYLQLTRPASKPRTATKSRA